MAVSNATEFRVNSNTQFDQSLPASATLADGSVVVVWTDASPFTGESLQLQHFDAAGQLIGTQAQITGQVARYEPASISALTGGGFVVSWAYGGGIHVQRFNADGVAVGGDVQVSPGGLPYQHIASEAITGLADGGWLVAWRAEVDSAGYQQVYSQRYDASGAPVGQQPLIVQSERIPIGSISVTSLLSGGWVATWLANGQVLQRRYDAGGQPAGDGSAQLVAADSGDPPHVAALADGGWVVLYPGTFTTLDAQRYDSAGHAVGEPVRVSDSATSMFGVGAGVTGLAGGGWVVAWQTRSSDPYDPNPIDIHAQRFDAAGAKVGGEIVVNTETQSGQITPSVTALHDGGFLVSWTSSMQDSDDTGAGIYAARFDAGGVAQSQTGWLQGDGANDMIQWDGAGPARLAGYGGNDTLAGGAGNDFLDGGTGNDLLRIGSGHDNVNGGDGVDTAVFDMSTAGIAGAAHGVHTAYTVSTAGGTFDLSNIERAQFSNGLFAIDTQAPVNFQPSTGGDTWWAAAMWHLGFGSLPGTQDLSRWTAQIDHLGGSQTALAQAMLDAYAPHISNEDLITHLFQVHAHRDPTDIELQAYMRYIAPSPPPSGGSQPWFETQAGFLGYIAQDEFNVDALVGFTGSVQPLDPTWF